MIIKEVSEIKEANICDNLLTELIQDERQYNPKINKNYIVKDYYKNYINRDDAKIFVATKDNEIMGYIFILVNDFKGTEENNAKIDALFVKKEYRNKGVATKLVNTAKDWIKSKGINAIIIGVTYNNEIAKKLYYKMGFENFSLTLKCNI